MTMLADVVLRVTIRLPSKDIAEWFDRVAQPNQRALKICFIGEVWYTRSWKMGKAQSESGEGDFADSSRDL